METGTELNVDNLAAIHVATVQGGSKVAKHIRLRFANVREFHLRKKIKLAWVSTKEQIADIFTKCLPIELFVRFRKAILSR